MQRDQIEEWVIEAEKFPVQRFPAMRRNHHIPGIQIVVTGHQGNIRRYFWDRYGIARAK